MTHFDDLNERQKDAITGILVSAYSRHMEDERFYFTQVYRLLVLGNGAGIALLTAFMGGIASSGNPIIMLVPPIWKFVIGAICATFSYIPLAIIASGALNHIEREIKDVILNIRDLESIQGYGPTPRGYIVLGILFLLSFGFWLWGIIQCVGVLQTL